MKKYLLHGDTIFYYEPAFRSVYVSARQLMTLYGLTEDECYLVDAGEMLMMSGRGLIHLFPRIENDYKNYLALITGVPNG